jgi:hypothetical protein
LGRSVGTSKDKNSYSISKWKQPIILGRSVGTSKVLVKSFICRLSIPRDRWKHISFYTDAISH